MTATLTLVLPSLAFAQDTRWELVDTGVLNHSVHGSGIEMRISPDTWPRGLLEAPDLPELMASLCNHYAPSVIPWVMEHADIRDPQFIAVRLISGGSLGKYVLQAYTISQDGCGDAL